MKEREQRKQHNLLHSQEATQPEIFPPSSTDSTEESQVLIEQPPLSPHHLDIGNYDQAQEKIVGLPFLVGSVGLGMATTSIPLF